MGVTGRPAATPRPSGARPAWQVGGVTVLCFVAALYAVELVDQLLGYRLDRYGIQPLQTDGLAGILFAPLLHASWTHLIANTGPLLVLGFLLALAGRARFLTVTAIIWLAGGLGTWLIGDLGGCRFATNHIGASGLIFGWLAFLLVYGWLVRRAADIVIGLVVLFAYGGVLLGALPELTSCSGVSWQSHLCGALTGVLAAVVVSRRSA